METFIVRVWLTGPHEGTVPARVLRGFVRHVRTGRETSFGSWEDLRGVLADHAATASSPAGGHGDGEAS